MNDSALSFRRWAVILAAGLSGVIVLISMLFDPAPDAEGRELLQAYAANDRAQGVHTNLIGAELGVGHSGVAVRLHQAGVTLRRGGAPRYLVDTQRILDLRDQGFTMTAIAAEVGMSVPGAWAGYYRTRPTERAGTSVSTAPVRMIPWQKLLAEALNEHEVIWSASHRDLPP